MSDELDDILKCAARENLRDMGISERSIPPTSNSVALLVKRMRSLADLASHKEPAISEALIDGVVQIERLTRAAAEVEMMAVTLDARDREIERLRAALAGLKDLTCGECVPCNRINAEIDKALSGEPASGHETGDELQQLRRVYRAAWAHRNAEPGDAAIEAYGELDDALWARRRAEKASGEPTL